MEHNQDGCKKDEACAVINVYCGGEKPCPPCPEQKCGAIEFAEAYSISPQTLAASPGANMPGDSVKLENLVFSTSNIDSSMAGINGQFTINLSGWYDVAAGMTGALNPIPSPLPVWTLSLYKNGQIIPGSTFSNVPLSPAQSSNEITADTFVHFNKGDVLSLANTSNVQLFLSAPSLGTNAQTNSAYLKIQLLKEDSSSVSPLINAANSSFQAALSSANASFAAGTAVNLSQSPVDANAALASANAALADANAAQAALLAASGVATPASYAMASANLASLLSLSNNSLAAANLVVGSLNPANTAALVLSNSQAQNGAVPLAANPLVML